MQAHIVHGDSAEYNYCDTSFGITDGLDGHGNWDSIPEGGPKKESFLHSTQNGYGGVPWLFPPVSLPSDELSNAWISTSTPPTRLHGV
jgi:hypothetical protein